MKRLLILTLAILLMAAVASADQFPAQTYGAQAHPSNAGAFKKPQVYQGYVPPPNIQHTWPGGYRVIFNELTNTFIEHVLGLY